MRLSALYIYPVKSCAAAARSSAIVEARGLLHDRRWMVVDEAGRFITAREAPRLVLLRAHPSESGLRLEAPDSAPLDVPPTTADARRRPVIVWRDEVDAADAGDDAARWLAALLGRPARLVHMDATSTRPIDPERARSGDEVSFADGYPLLVISQASLDGLNERLAAPLPMQRFRPNLVIEGATPHAEDDWRRVRIGELELECVKPCLRCVLTTVDPARGEHDPRGEPLRTLNTYRRRPGGVTFGVNLIARGLGTLRVGDLVEVLE
jgi:uncharacterized protein YcbX